MNKPAQKAVSFDEACALLEAGKMVRSGATGEIFLKTQGVGQVIYQGHTIADEEGEDGAVLEVNKLPVPIFMRSYAQQAFSLYDGQKPVVKTNAERAAEATVEAEAQQSQGQAAANQGTAKP